MREKFYSTVMQAGACGYKAIVIHMRSSSYRYNVSDGEQSIEYRNSIFVINSPDYSTGVDRNCSILGKDQGVDIHF